jgi:serine/threonine-protein kinase HipA
MRRAEVFIQYVKAGVLEEIEKGKKYSFRYDDGYTGLPISLTMPVKKKRYDFTSFPTFFEGFLPEGILLEGLLRIRKIDADDYYSQLMAVGEDMVGAVTVREIL